MLPPFGYILKYSTHQFILILCERNKRREEFLDVFRTVRPRFDYEDGVMEEAAFRILFDRKCSKNFSLHEFDDNLEFLEQQGKLMRSDGMIYIID